MSIWDAFSKVTVTALQRPYTTERVTSVLEEVFTYNWPLPLSLAQAAIRGENLIDINIVSPSGDEIPNLDQYIRSAKAEVATNYSSTAIEAGIRLSRMLENAPVEFEFMGVPIRVTSKDKRDIIEGQFDDALRARMKPEPSSVPLILSK